MLSENIIEVAGKKVNKDSQGWFQTKVDEIAQFLVRKLKEENEAMKDSKIWAATNFARTKISPKD